jgi:zinc D-Ala-D-Ala carboxypeptidase
MAPTAVLPAGLTAAAPTTTGSVDVEAAGVLALDPLFVATPALDVDAGLDGASAPVQPLRRPRGKDRAQAQTTRRAVKAVAERAPRRSGAALPQAGIAGALGIATIAVPLAGALGIAHGSRPSGPAPRSAAAAALTPLPPVPLVASGSLTALGDRRLLLPAQAPVAEVPSELASRIRVTKSRTSRSAPRPVLRGCDGRTPDVSGVQNGRLPASMLCTLWDPKRQLRSDAAVALAKLNVVYRKRFGHPICFNDAYRSLTQQYRIKALRGGYAARPGTSEHGWGLAVDLCDGVDDGAGSATYEWLRANAPAYGWQNPTWARRGGSGPYEPWHWEYLPGEQGQSKGD